MKGNEGIHATLLGRRRWSTFALLQGAVYCNPHNTVNCWLTVLYCMVVCDFHHTHFYCYFNPLLYTFSVFACKQKRMSVQYTVYLFCLSLCTFLNMVSDTNISSQVHAKLCVFTCIYCLIYFTKVSKHLKVYLWLTMIQYSNSNWSLMSLSYLHTEWCLVFFFCLARTDISFRKCFDWYVGYQRNSP